MMPLSRTSAGQLVGLRRRLVDLLDQSLEHGLRVFEIAEVDQVPLEIVVLHLGLELGERHAGHGLDLRSPVCAVNGSKNAFLQAVSHTPP